MGDGMEKKEVKEERERSVIERACEGKGTSKQLKNQERYKSGIFVYNKIYSYLLEECK